MLRLSTLLLLAGLAAAVAAAAGVTSFTRTVPANGKTFTVQGVRVDLHDPAVSLKAGLAWGLLGRTEALAGIAKRYGAVAAINGSFFDAYSHETLRNPDMALISGGQLLYKSNLGSILGFEADNTPHLERVTYRLVGTLTKPDGRPQQWHVYWLNRRPTSTVCATLFTRHWGTSVEPMGGTAAVVEDGTITQVTAGKVTIPENGYVIHVRNEPHLLSYFKVGEPIRFTPETTLAGDTDPEAWARVQEGVGAGPRVLRDGVPVFAPSAEGFGDPKILTLAGARSAAGYTRDGLLYLITVRGARVADLGHLLKALGCVEGMNLDGGASSGLWYRGTYLTTPGRAISNALLVLEKK